MPDTVPVTIEVDAAAAAALADARTRAAMGRLVSRVLHPRPGLLLADLVERPHRVGTVPAPALERLGVTQDDQRRGRLPAVAELAQPILGIKRGRISFSHPAAFIHRPEIETNTSFNEAAMLNAPGLLDRVRL